MFEAQEINAEHKDLIHDVAYDFYGQRMATCSSDQYVKVSMFLSIFSWANIEFVGLGPKQWRQMDLEF